MTEQENSDSLFLKDLYTLKYIEPENKKNNIKLNVIQKHGMNYYKDKQGERCKCHVEVSHVV